MRFSRSRRGGVLLDSVLAIILLFLLGFTLSHFGFTFSEIVNGARQFFTH
jgi:hypothetical protein